jgi:hypothetical protein
MSKDTSKEVSLSDKMINKCEVILRGLNVNFYIQRENGEEIINGNLNIKAKKTKSRVSRPRLYPHGTYAQFIKDSGVHEMAEGSILRIPCKEFDPRTIQGSISAYCSSHWGKGTHTTAISKDYVEVFRHPPLGEQ